MRRSSGSFFIFMESFLTVPGDLSLSITPSIFWKAGLDSEGAESAERETLSATFLKQLFYSVLKLKTLLEEGI